MQSSKIVDFIRRAPGLPRRLAVFPGSFNPPTRAHVALAQAALTVSDEVLWALPKAFPHKAYEDATLDDRLAMLSAALDAEPRFSLAVTGGGLFREIAHECRGVYVAADLWFLCGRDAAERIVNWDYGTAGDFREQLAGFGLLVAARAGPYSPPLDVAARIRPLVLDACYDGVSASEVRRRVRAGEEWEGLVSPAIVELVRRTYA